LEALIRELQLEDSVELLGFVNNPYPLLKAADLFVLSSLWEGMSTVLIEAMTLRVPVVATDCISSPRELLRDGSYGVLVPPGDHAALAQGIRQALKNPLLAPIDWTERFQQDKAVGRYVEVLESIAKNA